MFFGSLCMLIGLVIGWFERDRRGPFLPKAWTFVEITFIRGDVMSVSQKGLPLSVSVTATKKQEGDE